jgi:hypothetical protein
VDGALVPARLGARLVQLSARTSALLVAAPEQTVARIVFELPPGLAPRPGAPERIEGPFGAFAREERAEPGKLVRDERVVLLRGRVAPERYAALAGFAAAVDAAQERPTVFARTR